MPCGNGGPSAGWRRCAWAAATPSRWWSNGFEGGRPFDVSSLVSICRDFGARPSWSGGGAAQMRGRYATAGPGSGANRGGVTQRGDPRGGHPAHPSLSIGYFRPHGAYLVDGNPRRAFQPNAG